MKYKPTLFGITKEVAKLKQPSAVIITGILETALNLGTAYYGGYVAYSCGNPKCNGTFILASRTRRPLVCPKCGEEIDWVGIATRKIKICPQCNSEYHLDDNYCPYHLPKVGLVEKEIPL
jgi:hypothetical protein